MKLKDVRNYKKNSGITLIALVVTIVVLLILAGITINMLFSENGIIIKAKEAAEKTEQAGKEEMQGMQGVVSQIEELTSGEIKNDKIKVSYSTTEGSNLWSTTITMNITLTDEEELSIEQKRNIATYLCEFSSYEELGVDNLITELSLTEEQILNKIIEKGREYIDYSDKEKLESLGIKVISVVTPYDSILYTSNLDGEVKCSFGRNGTYDFKIKSGENEITETIIINNIRTVETQTPYNVNVEFANSTFEGSTDKLLYSVDEENIWQELTENTIIECNDSIYIKFGNTEYIQEGTTNSLGLHYVEKNDEYYKYFNEESPIEWLGIRFNSLFPLIFNNITSEGMSIKQAIILDSLKQSSTLLNILPISYHMIELYEEFPEGLTYKVAGKDIDFPEEIASKYPYLNLGYDNVITWTYDENESESPVYKLEVAHDMNILVYQEAWD